MNFSFSSLWTATAWPCWKTPTFSSFTIEVQDEESHDTLFAVPVTLNVVNFPAATPDFPTDAEPAYAPEVLLILPEGGYGEWQFVDGDMLRMRVTVENTSPARAVEAFEIYMYAVDAWGDPLYGEDYVYFETTETLVEPFETAMSEYVTMPRASDIAPSTPASTASNTTTAKSWRPTRSTTPGGISNRNVVRKIAFWG